MTSFPYLQNIYQKHLNFEGKNWGLPEQSDKQILVNYYTSINPVQ